MPLAALSVPHAIGLAGMALILPFAVRNVPRFWRHELRTYDRVPAAWPWGDALWRGWVRAIPIGTATLAVGLVAALSGLAVDEDPSGPLPRPLWWAVPALAVLAIAFALMLGVVLLNRPKRIVAPHLRSEAGAIEEWWSAMRGRRRRRTA